MRISYKNISLFLSTLLLILPCIVFSQTTLKTQLEGKSTLSDIMSVVEDHYKGKPSNWIGDNGSLPKLKHWKRWEWYMANRLGPKGEFVDISKKNLDAYQQYASSTRTINNSWDFLGPSSIDNFGVGRADRIAFHPVDSLTYYVGTSGGGLWKTADDGITWTPLTDFIASLGISGVVVNQSNPNIIYILTGDGDSDLFGGLVNLYDYQRLCKGVYKSTNGGTTWSKTADLDSDNLLGMKMVSSPTDANVLLVATSIGIYRTANGGNSWTKVRTGEFHDVEFKPGANRAYAAGLDEILYSADGGQNWQNATLDSAVINRRRFELAVTPAKSSNVYLLAANSDTTQGVFAGFYKSIDNGVNFRELSFSPNILGGGSGGDAKQNARYTHAMAVSSVDTNKIVTGAILAWRSVNGGFSWIPSGGPHPDHHMMAYNPLTGNVYSCDDGGVYKSIDDGQNWTSLVNNLEASQIYHLAGTTAHPDFLLAGLQDNGVIQRTYYNTDFAELLYVDGYMLAYAPNTKDTIYIGGNGDLYRSTNGGVNLDSITPYPDSTNEFFGNILTHINSDSVLFAGFSSVFKSLNQGTTWTNTGASGNWAMANCPSNQNRIYSAGASTYGPHPGGKLWRSDNLGVTWDSLHTNPGFPTLTNSSRITDIAVDPTNANNVYVTMGSFIDGVKVYRSLFAGAGWENWSGSLPNVPVNAITVDASLGVYIGTDIGVFYRTPTMSDWMPYSNSLPNTPVTDFVIDQANDRIICSTFGRGVWTNALVEECPINLTISGTQTKYLLYQATNRIHSTADILGSENSSVHFQAGNRVILFPGFQASKNATFTARIAPCGGGGIPIAGEVEIEKK